MKNIIILCFCLVLNLFSNSQKDIVPDEKTAIKIAEAVWSPRFGKDIYKSKPFKATLENDSIWHVKGTLPKRFTFGGVPHAFISKKDGRIVACFHGK